MGYRFRPSTLGMLPCAIDRAAEWFVSSVPINPQSLVVRKIRKATHCGAIKIIWAPLSARMVVAGLLAKLPRSFALSAPTRDLCEIGKAPVFCALFFVKTPFNHLRRESALNSRGFEYEDVWKCLHRSCAHA